MHFGYVSLDEIRETVKDAEWQKLRKEMKGRALAEKYDMLLRYSERLTFGYLKGAYPCTNYVTRGGLIEPKAYRRD